MFETNKTKENGNHRQRRMFHSNSPIGIHTQNREIVREAMSGKVSDLHLSAIVN